MICGAFENVCIQVHAHECVLWKCVGRLAHTAFIDFRY